MNTVCIVIPIYKETPTDIEIASFRQALKVLHKYDFFIYTHKELNLSIYLDEANSFNKKFQVEYFDKDYFASVKGYNKLCLAAGFYKRVS